MKRIAFALFLLLPATALAQTSPPSAPVQDWSKDIETVTVTAPRPGPALWHISQIGSDVWILPLVGPMPSDLKWNSAALKDVITGAKRVYMPPELTAGVLEASWFLLTGLHKIKLEDGQTLLTVLPPDLRARYAGWLVKLGKDADTDEDYQPAAAGLDLLKMFLDKNKIDPRTTENRIEDIADDADVSAKPLAKYEAMPIVDEIPFLSADSEQRCMRDALDDIDTQAVHADAAARAWAVGDIAGIKANYSETKFYDCFEQTKTFSADREHAITDLLNAVHASLATPGKSLIVVSVGEMLRKGGLLDRLTAEGIKIEGPTE